MNATGNRVWIALSPRILLEICLDRESAELCTRRHFDLTTDSAIYKNYRRLAIQNALSEIVFHEKGTLDQWRQTFEFRERVKELRETKAARQEVIDVMPLHAADVKPACIPFVDENPWEPV